MKTNISAETAQIYLFPPRGRFALNTRGESQMRTSLESPPLVKVLGGSGWYHDAAIQEAEPRG
jgi:hypothetical protein